jgi:hypothetical protein
VKVDVSFPDRIELRALEVSAADGAWTLQVPQLKLRRPLWLGSSSTAVHVRMPDQAVRLRMAGRTWQAQLRGDAVLADVGGELVDARLERAFFTARDLGRVGDAHIAGRVQVRLQSDGPRERRSLHGRIFATGQDVQRPLELLRAGAALRWLFPQAVGEHFSAGAQLKVSSAELRLKSIVAHGGGLSLAGGLRWTAGEPHGALLIETSVRRIGLVFSGSDPRPVLTPAPDWLQQTLDSSGLAGRSHQEGCTSSLYADHARLCGARWSASAMVAARELKKGDDEDENHDDHRRAARAGRVSAQ